MARGIDWSASMDATLRGLRAQGRDCSQIAAVLSISKHAVISRMDRLGLPTGQGFRHRPAPLAVIARDPAPLPPGHPSSWGAISNQAWPQPGARAA